VSEMATTEIRRQLVGIEVIRPLHSIILTIGVETIVAPTTNFVRIGVLIGFAINLGCGSRGVSTGRNLSRSLRILVATTRVVGTPHMVFTNPIMTTHVNRTTN